MVIHRVGISQYSAACDNEAAGGAAELPLSLPWEGIIGFRMYAKHLEALTCHQKDEGSIKRVNHCTRCKESKSGKSIIQQTMESKYENTS